ncbi:UDP-N-acetylglucosamine 2-epimerase [Thalassospira alkalitolerans]|uniref:UDP-N-acetylglucosamine 2-epimerase n=1 Tax=Thalassospira alkalitolerans TaxID=1293890 RepID=UPI0030EE4CF1|tara:strand:- start:29607 stop:30758 length:1152 start_codon:yes stop_codon:yes gene_type:complete
MKRVCIVVGSRANYSSIKSVLRYVQEHPELTLQVVAAASALLDRYGAVANLIESDGFPIDARVSMLIEGETPETMAKSTGVGLLELPTVFTNLKPDVVLTVGDRFETMATAIAAAYMNIPLAHTMGGEVSGTIDESIRHAITKLAHIHFPASSESADRIVKLGESVDHVHMVGCPRIDLIKDILGESLDPEEDLELETGVGAQVNFKKPFLLVSQHPVTTEYEDAEKQILETLHAVNRTGMQAVVLWPNADAGSEKLARGIRKMREHDQADNMRFYKNLPISTYVRLMKHCACLVGNSSSGIREGAFIGTPVVNVGSRQNNRERGANVMDAVNDRLSIYKAILAQVEHGPYESEHIYGDGFAGQKIADILASKQVLIQKQITY